MQALIGELTELSAANDAMLATQEENIARMRQLEARADEYKRLYERAKTELRSLKGQLIECSSAHRNLYGVQSRRSFSCSLFL
jgi:hypothetical protein